MDESLATLKDESSEIYRLWMTGILEHTRGNRAASQAALQQLEDEYRETMSYQIAELYACRGEADKTFQWLQEAERLKDFGLDMAHLSTCLRSVHQDPRWLPFLNRIGRDPGQLDRIPLQVSVPEQPETGSA